MIKIDLHMHSYHSDGTLDCQMLLEEIKAKNIKMFSLTDHDCISGLKEMKTAIEGEDIYFVPGVEIATTYLKQEFHLTTYGYDENNKHFLEMVENNHQIRKSFDIEIIKFLERHLDVDISLEDFIAYEDDPYLGGWPSLNFLKAKGVIRDLGDFFVLLEKFDLDLIFPEPESIIKVAHEAGASVFLAHPSSNAKGGLSIDVLDDFRRFGIDGLECYSPYCKSDEESQYYLDYCSKYKLKVSGGSDYHGQFVGRTLGTPHVTSEMISYEFFLKLIK